MYSSAIFLFYPLINTRLTQMVDETKLGPGVEVVVSKTSSVLNTVRPRKCFSCCCVLNPGADVYEIDCYKVDKKGKHHPLATRYLCEFCFDEEPVEDCELSEEQKEIIDKAVKSLAEEQSNKEEISKPEPIKEESWFKRFLNIFGL